MRRSHFIPMLFLLSLLGACGRPQVPASVATPTGQQAYVSRVTSANAGQPTAAASLTPTTVPSPSTASTTSPSPTRSAATSPSPTNPAAAPPSPTRSAATSPSPTNPAASPTAERHLEHVIAIEFPKPNATISSPLTLSGSTNFWPFEGTLGAKLKDAQGSPLGQIPVTVQSQAIGQGGPWSERLTFTPPAQPQTGILEVFDTSAKDGTITTIARVTVRLVPAGASGTTPDFDLPQEGSVVTMPLHVALGGAGEDEELTLRLLQNGSARLSTKVRAERGYVVTTLRGPSIAGSTTLEVVRNDGTLLGQQRVRVATAAETLPVKVAWVSKV